MKKARTMVNQDRQYDDNKIKNDKLTRNEVEVLNQGYKYNFPSTNSTHIKQNMISEAQIAINKLQIDDI